MRSSNPLEEGAPSRANIVGEYGRSVERVSADALAQEPALLLNALVKRDAVAAEVVHGECVPEDAVRLVQIDESLRAGAAELVEALPPGTLEAWRSSLCPTPAATAWWWRLEQVPAETVQRRSPWWPVTTGILLAVSASLTADIVRRFLSNGPDFYGALSTISQGAVTVIAGSSLTETGRNWLNRWLQSFGVHPERNPRVYTMLAGGVLSLVGLLYLALPWIALNYYDARGQELFRRGEIHNAIEHFQRAVSLAPSKHLPHYDLADALEESFDVDRAIGEYQAAIQLKPDFYQAYNNLARLYLVKKKDPESALRALRKGINAVEAQLKDRPEPHCPSDPICDGLYALHKNFAWVDVEKQWYKLARISATEALKVHPERAAIYCVLAQIEVAEGEPDKATISWGKCINGARQLRGSELSRQEDVEEIWIGMAKEREQKLGTKR